MALLHQSWRLQLKHTPTRVLSQSPHPLQQNPNPTTIIHPMPHQFPPFRHLLSDRNTTSEDLSLNYPYLLQHLQFSCQAESKTGKLQLHC